MQALLKRPALLAGGGVAYLGGVVLAYEYVSPKVPLPSACERCRTFNCLAPGYDAEIERDEASSGILERRRDIASYAKGKVLEVAGRTGRNLAFPRFRQGVPRKASQASPQASASAWTSWLSSSAAPSSSLSSTPRRNSSGSSTPS